MYKHPLIGTFFVLLFSLPVLGQEKLVLVERIEVNGKPVNAVLRVSVTSKTESILLQNNEKGFLVPQRFIDANPDEFVALEIRLDKFVLNFCDIHISTFGVNWQVVGVNTGPFQDEEKIDGKGDLLQIHYIHFAGEPGRVATVKIYKDKLK